MSVLRSYIAPSRRMASPLLLINQRLAPSYLGPSFSTTSFREVAVGKETSSSSTSRANSVEGESPPNVDHKRSASRTLTHAAEETAPYVPLVIVLAGVAAATGIARASAHFEWLRLRSYMDDRFRGLHDEMMANKVLLVQLQERMQDALAPLTMMSASLEKLDDRTRQLEIQFAVTSALADRDKSAR